MSVYTKVKLHTKGSEVCFTPLFTFRSLALVPKSIYLCNDIIYQVLAELR